MMIKPVHYYKARIDGAHRLTPTVKSRFVSTLIIGSKMDYTSL